MTYPIGHPGDRPHSRLDRLLLHAVNVAWMSYLAVRAFMEHGAAERNFLADPVLVIQLSLAVVLHSMQWRRLSKQHVGLAFTSARDLRIEFDRTAKDLLGAIPYLPRLLPNSDTLDKRATQLVGEGPVILRTRQDTMRLLLCTPWLQPVHLMAAVASGAFLWFGDFPSFAALLSPFWPALAIALVLAAGMFIQSTVLLLFAVFFT